MINNLEEFLEIRVESIGLNSSLFYNTENYIASEKINDYENMNFYLEKSIKIGSVDALFYIGNYYDEMKDHPKMVHFYEKAAEKNDLDSIYNLAIYYKEKKNRVKRKVWLLKGVELGDPDCMCEMAKFYEESKEEDKEEKIIKYYRLAIKLKYLKAYYLLGMWYSKNHEPDEMAFYFMKAIDDFRDNSYLKNKQHNNVYIDENYNIDLVVKMMLKTACYYDDEMRDNTNAIKYYELATKQNSVQAMYNLGRIYYELDIPEKMKKYFLMAIEFDDDIDSMFDLSIYFQDIRDMENMKKYYLMALSFIDSLKNTIGSLINDGIKDFNVFMVKEILETVVNPPDYVISKLQKFKQIKEIMIFENKKKLFTQLNNIVECGICYEVKLNINLSCGHCCCINCYPQLFNKTCPFCRL
jgi:TPR repeat protein